MGKVVSFYSFKGGTGRSTGLCNIAYELARRGESVGCMDFDVSAPGLHWIFDPGANVIANTRSIHDYLSNASSSHDLDDYVIDLNRSFRNDDLDGNLLLMYGDINAKVAAESLANKSKYDVIRNLIADFEASRDLDYVFLDSRSGISNQAMPIFRAAELFLIFTKWTNQHKVGTNELIDWIMETNPELGDMLCVPSNIPASVPREKIEAWVKNDLHFKANDFRMIPESEALKENEQILTKDARGSEVTDQYAKIADWIQEQ